MPKQERIRITETRGGALLMNVLRGTAHFTSLSTLSTTSEEDPSGAITWFADSFLKGYLMEGPGAAEFLSYRDLDVIYFALLLVRKGASTEDVSIFSEAERLYDRTVEDTPWPVTKLLVLDGLPPEVGVPIHVRYRFLCSVIGDCTTNGRTDWRSQHLRDIIPDWSGLEPIEYQAREVFRSMKPFFLFRSHHRHQGKELLRLKSEIEHQPDWDRCAYEPAAKSVR